MAAIYIFSIPTSYAAMLEIDKGSNDIIYYGDGSACGTSQTSATGDGGGCGSQTDSKANEKQIWNFLKSKGLTDEAAAGILGNSFKESTYIPSATNGIGCRGFVQWCFERNTALDAFAAQAGKPWDCLEVQLNYMWHEMEDGSSIGRSDGVKLPDGVKLYDVLNGADFPQKSQYTGSGPAQAAKIFHDYFERSNTATGEDKGRPEAAETAYKEMTGKDAAGATALSQGTAISGGGSGGACSTGSGASGDFVYYNQNDPQWQASGLPVAEAGCGPTSIAMIIATKRDKSVTPDVVAQYLQEQGTWSSHGIVWTGFAQAGEHWGMTVTDIGTNFDMAIAALKAGNLLTVSGTGSKPFSSGGHIIVARGVTEDGKIVIANPAPGLASGAPESSAYTPAELQAAGLANMWVFS